MSAESAFCEGVLAPRTPRVDPDEHPCDECGRGVTLGAAWYGRVSTGFGLANDRSTGPYCSRECRARGHGECVVCRVATQQSTLAAFDAATDRADAIAWSR